MNKEDILAKSREENKNGDEREQKVREHAYAMSATYGGLICMIMVMLEDLVFNRDTRAIWIIYGGMLFANSLTGAIQTKSKKYIGLSVLFGTLLILELVVYFIDGFR